MEREDVAHTDDVVFDRRAGDKSALERHFATVMQVLVVALLGWSLNTTQGLSQDVAVLKVQVEAMTATMQQGTSDRYRGSDATRDFMAVREELDRLDKRIQRLEDDRK